MIQKTEGFKTKKQLRRESKNRKKKRIENLIKKAKYLYYNSVSGNDYLQMFFNDLKILFIDNHNVMNKIWLNLKTITRVYLKEKWKLFIKIKDKILDDINKRRVKVEQKFKRGRTRKWKRDRTKWTIVKNDYILITYDSFLLSSEQSPTEVPTEDLPKQNVLSDFSKDVYLNVQKYINTIVGSNESFISSIPNDIETDNIKVVKYYVDLFDKYADDAFFKKNDKLDKILTDYEKYYDKNAGDIKEMIDTLYKTDANTLAYINKKVEFVLKIINTIPSTNYGKILNA
jgi:hypothetical protein